jgi:phosphate transport system substrate-binding protein
MNATRFIRSSILMHVAAGIAVACAGCGGSSDDSSPPIIIDGSSTVVRISKAAQQAFNKVKPEIVVVVDEHGTGGGFGRYLQGEVDIVDASRLAKPDEESKAKAQGIEWTKFIVGYDGITLAVNPKNDFVKSLTAAQLKSLWSPDSKVAKWKDLDPAWPDRKIQLFSPDSDSGTFEFFTEAIVGKAKSQREDVQASSSDNTLVAGVAGDADAIGYFGFAYYAANKDKLRAVPVQNLEADKPVMPSLESILDKSYSPLSRPLFIYVKNSAARRPEVSAFLKFYLEQIDDFAAKGGYASPSADDKTNNLQLLGKLTPKGGDQAKEKVASLTGNNTVFERTLTK